MKKKLWLVAMALGPAGCGGGPSRGAAGDLDPASRSSAPCTLPLSAARVKPQTMRHHCARYSTSRAPAVPM